MYLNREEERMLGGEYGAAVQKAIEILVAIGDIKGAERMIEIDNSHISGASYKETHDAGLRFLEMLSETSVRTFTTISSIAIDLESLDKVPIPEYYLKKQLRLVEAFKRLGIISTYTCTPYLVGNVPTMGSHIAWSPSECIIAANAYFGARTNRESDVSAAASAICGRTPEYGYHLDENRGGDLLVRVDAELKTSSDYSALGYVVGDIARDRVPVFTGIKGMTVESSKAMGSALGTSGAVSMYHIVGITPEARSPKGAFIGDTPEEIVSVGEEELAETRAKLCDAEGERIDAVCIGCPHCSIEELRQIAEIMRGERVHRDTSLWICTAPQIKYLASKMGIIDVIEEAGGYVLGGACVTSMPNEALPFKTIATNSAKMAHYAPEEANLEPLFGDLERCLDAAVTGRWNR